MRSFIDVWDPGLLRDPRRRHGRNEYRTMLAPIRRNSKMNVVSWGLTSCVWTWCGLQHIVLCSDVQKKEDSRGPLRGAAPCAMQNVFFQTASHQQSNINSSLSTPTPQNHPPTQQKPRRATSRCNARETPPLWFPGRAFSIQKTRHTTLQLIDRSIDRFSRRIRRLFPPPREPPSYAPPRVRSLRQESSLPYPFRHLSPPPSAR